MKEDSEQPMDQGPQPLESVMSGLGIKNSDLVSASTEQLTHKVVAKGRKGRRLTYNAQMKILRALNTVQTDREFGLKDLFSYEGRRK